MAAAAAMTDAIQAHEDYVREPAQEAPLNCQHSPAASRAVAGERVCKRLLSDVVDMDEEADLVWECACALATHNIWYKSMVGLTVKRLSRYADQRCAWLADKVASKLVLVNTFDDRVDSLQRLNWYARKSLKERLLEDLAEDGTPSKGLALAEEACEQVTYHERWTHFIGPSLKRIERSMYGGPNLKHALLATQPELDQVVGTVNLCQNIILKRHDPVQ